MCPLTDDGKQASQKLISKFKKIPLDGAFSSPYLRTIQTIKPLADTRNLHISLVEDLAERHANLAEAWSLKLVERYWQDFDYSAQPGDETLHETQKRSVRAIKNICRLSSANCLVGVHGTSLGTILNYYDKSFGYVDWLKIQMPDVFVLTFKDKPESKPEISRM